MFLFTNKKQIYKGIGTTFKRNA